MNLSRFLMGMLAPDHPGALKQHDARVDIFLSVLLSPLVLVPGPRQVGEVEAGVGVGLAVDGRALRLVHDLPRAEGGVVPKALETDFNLN